MLFTAVVEPGAPVPLAVGEGVVEHGEAVVARVQRESDVDLVEPLPDLEEVLDQGLVQLHFPADLLPDVCRDLVGPLLEFNVQGIEPVLALTLRLGRHSNHDCGIGAGDKRLVDSRRDPAVRLGGPLATACRGPRSPRSACARPMRQTNLGGNGIHYAELNVARLRRRCGC